MAEYHVFQAKMVWEWLLFGGRELKSACGNYMLVKHLIHERRIRFEVRKPQNYPGLSYWHPIKDFYASLEKHNPTKGHYYPREAEFIQQICQAVDEYALSPLELMLVATSDLTSDNRVDTVTQTSGVSHDDAK